MWGSVLVLAFLAALNPVRLGVALLVMSRPRPVQNLFAFWVGCLAVSVVALLVPLMVLHFTPRLSSFAHDLATPATAASSTVRHIQIGLGVFALAVAALMTARLSTRRRGGAAKQETLAPPAMSRLLDATHDPRTDGGSVLRRLFGRAQHAWEHGALWISLVVGLAAGPSPDGLLYVLAIIVPSGVSFATQVVAAIAVVVGMLAVIEITLAGFLATPAKTEVVARWLHDWALARRQQIVIAVCAVAGISLVALGMHHV
ncbi:hypothetical protein A5707_22170 [Mycobacterium kyorinense]|uniref:Gap protein n=1 Tax=Mycobacterium kyorinense TaxID=487514 RepID=A0A1A2Z997_9MYCO|nr:GAP family protein [Mycobacterium kyorinense]OBI46092.1 hypothetical protein A5707_22170 [Mycobacterium kyorinense]